MPGLNKRASNQTGTISTKMEDMFSINAMCYIGFVYSLVLQIFSRLIIKSQLEDE